MLHETIGSWITGGVHHVGSTAVSGLDAKPIIDIAVRVESLEASRPCIELLHARERGGEIDYFYTPYRGEGMPSRLAAEYSDDREAYTSAKSDIVAHIVAVDRE